MAIEGSLSEFRLPEILQAVAQQQRTGILTLQSETTIVAVSFLGGGVVSADSLAHTVEERLGEALVDEGLVDRATIGDLSRRQEAGEGRLLDLLVSEGVLSREGVLDALRRQNLALLRDLLDWRHGEFKFYGGDEVAYEEGIEPISIEGLLLSTLGGDDGEGGEVDAAVAAWTLAGDEPSEAAGADPWEAAEAAAAAEPVEAIDAAFAADAAIAPPPPALAPEAVAAPRPAPRPAAPRPAAPRPAAVPAAERPSRPHRPRPRPPAAAPAALRPPADPAARVVPATLGVLLAAGLVAAALAAPVRLLVPFPWQGAERQALAEVQRLADRLAVDRAAKTFFLLEGHFPSSLEPLIDAGLLDREDRVGPGGQRLELVAREDSYDIVAEGAGEPLWSEAISGNFLLDPELRGGPAASTAGDEQPLVLLD